MCQLGRDNIETLKGGKRWRCFCHVLRGMLGWGGDNQRNGSQQGSWKQTWQDYTRFPSQQSFCTPLHIFAKSIVLPSHCSKNRVWSTVSNRKMIFRPTTRVQLNLAVRRACNNPGYSRVRCLSILSSSTSLHIPWKIAQQRPTLQITSVAILKSQ